VITVTHLITGLDVGGAETMLARLVTASNRNRIRHNVISMHKPGAMATQIQAAGVPATSLNMTPGIPDPRAIFRLRHRLLAEKPDVLQSWMYHANLLASVAGPAARVPVVWNMRAVPDFDYGRQVALIDAVLSRVAWLPTTIVVNSESGQEYMARRGYKGGRWKVIPNGFDTTVFRPDPAARLRLRMEWGVTQDQVLVGLVARLDPVKAHPTFLEAARKIGEFDSTVRFVCVGSGPQDYVETLQRLAESKGLRDRVIWAGARSDIASVNCAFDIATCCSLSESFPNVVGEAMACGVPCVVTDVGDAALMVGDTGAVVPPGSPSALAEAWRSMIAAGPMRRRELGEQARARIVERFSIDRIVADYEDLYTMTAAGA
jgi:glycosyltransferase involved in cell wall biosynthesis